VGILQSEAEGIDEYVCPRCDPHSKLNLPNMAKLGPDDHDLIRKLLKQIAVRFCRQLPDCLEFVGVFSFIDTF
jgi:hypothetical protein